MEELEAIAGLSDREVIAGLKRAAASERECIADVLLHLIEFDRRQLHAPEGQPSLFYYCTRELGWAEEAAYKRIRAARAAADFRHVLRLLRSGRLHLGAVVALSAHLTKENHRDLLEKACGLSARELEFMVAGLSPRPDKADIMRRLPVAPLGTAGLDGPGSDLPPGASGSGAGASGGGVWAAPGPGPGGGIPPSLVETGSQAERAPLGAPFLPDTSCPPASFAALSAQRVRIAFTADRGLWERLEKARALLRHRFPDGRLEAVLGEALEALLSRIDPDRRSVRTEREAPARKSCGSDSRSRRIPSEVRDAVWRRDGGRCAFLGGDGQRCPSREFLQFDHIQPWSQGGPSDDPANVRLLCRTHNLYEARLRFGAWRKGRPEG